MSEINRHSEDSNEPDAQTRVLSVRVPENIYCAYGQIQEYYVLNQSDLIRMAPLLLVLLAEGSLAPRRKEVQEQEEKLKGQLGGGQIDWDKLRDISNELHKIDQEKVAIRNNELMGSAFIEHLRKLVEEADNTDVIDSKSIQQGKGGLPEYLIFQTQLLRQAAHEIAKTVKPSDIASLLEPYADKTEGDEQFLRQAAHEIATTVKSSEIAPLLEPYADNQYAGQLLRVAGNKLGRDLDDDQKKTLRAEFVDALKMRLNKDRYVEQLFIVARRKLGRDLDEDQRKTLRDGLTDALQMRVKFAKWKDTDKLGDAAYEVARRVRPEDVSVLLTQIGSSEPLEIPRRYDGQLLGISRGKLGKPLNMSEKLEVRRKFHNALQMIAKESTF